jgi:ATP-dependent DNA helicase DinG
VGDQIQEALDRVVTALSGEQRTGQIEMAVAVSEAFESGTHLLVQAGTGTGKSMGYLVPAALFAVQHETPVVVATATLALQRQLIERDIPALTEALEPILGRPLRAAVLKGRNNYVCLHRLNGGPVTDEDDGLVERSALGEQAVAVRAWAQSTQTGDRDEFPDPIDARVWAGFSVGRRECVGESVCAFGSECFTALRRTAAQEADIVITNHAMLAIDAIEGIPVLPEHGAIIIDEGHELVDRTTTALAITLNPVVIDRALTRARSYLPDVQRSRAHDASDALAAALIDVTGELRPIPDSVRAVLTMVRDSTREAVRHFDAEKSDPADTQRLRGALEEIADAANSFLGAGDSDVVWADGSLHRAPLSVAAALRERLFARGPVVVTSATLTVGGDFGALGGALGLDDDVLAIDVGSPFDYAKQGILYAAEHLDPPGRDGLPMAGLDDLADLIEAAGGRTLALFSSWHGVERAAEYLRVRLTADHPILVQARGDATGPLLERFAREPHTSLLGTMGLWQGVDVPGESCTCVVIDRIPFPRPDDPLLAARQRQVDEAGGSGFRRVSVPRAALLLAQGAGRLIRGPQDRGVVAVLDSRLARAGYGRILRDGLPPFWYTTDTDHVLGALRRLDALYREGETARPDGAR